MKVLALVHQDDAPPGTFGDVVRERGHELEVRSFAPGVGDPPSDDAASRYGAVMILGGSMQVDQDDRHPWLRDARALVRELIDREVPTFGVCLGGQLVAQTAGAEVGPAVVREVGWHPVELHEAGAADPVLGAAPRRFAAYQGHSYGFGLPPGATALAHGQGDALQAYRIGDAAWGVQFHPEVTPEIVDWWIAEHVRDGDIDDEAALREQSRANLPRWTAFGRALCDRFIAYAAAPPRSRDPRRP
jgi:GMP synthase-like glutamine amidotransferase